MAAPAFTPSSGIDLAVLGAIAKCLGQNAGAIDDHCIILGITAADVTADPRGTVQRIASWLDELDAAIGAAA